MKTRKQIVRKMKSFGGIANDLYEDLKRIPAAELNTSNHHLFIIEIRNKMKLLSWVSGVSYKQYLDKNIRG